MLERFVRLTLPRDEQHLLQARSTCGRSRLYATVHDVYRQWSLLAVSNLDRRPGGLRLNAAPTIHAHERVLGILPATRVFRRWRVHVADQGVRGDRQQIPFAASPQFQA